MNTTQLWDRVRAPSGPVSRTLRRAGLTAIGTYAAYTVHGLLHPALMRQSATPAERTMRLPGDDLVPDARWVTNFAVDIPAPPMEVWPWLVQVGYGRGGWYTWFPLDNGGVPSANRIVPELQRLAVGDVIPDGPRCKEGFGAWRVDALAPPHTMILRSRRNPVDGREIAPGEDGASYVDVSWVFHILETSPATSRLLVRVRGRFVGPAWAVPVTAAAQLFFGLGDNVMENSLLDGVRARVTVARA